MARRPRLPADDSESERHPDEQVARSEATRLIELVRSTVPPMHRAGIPFVSAGLAVAALGHRHRWLRTAGLSAAGVCAAFFRHPARIPPDRADVVVAPADGQISWTEPAFAVDRRIRGCTPAPGAWTTYDGERLKLRPVTVDVLDDVGLGPGSVEVSGGDVLVGTGSTAVRLGDVQAPGKPWMPAADWMRQIASPPAPQGRALRQGSRE